MDLQDIERIASQGESETVELKTSTGQLSRACEALCGFLNGRGGLVIFGVKPKGEIVGQLVADKTALLFLRRHLPVAGRVQPGLFERVDEPLFPLEALREALVNAFCHRDYSSPGGGVSLAVFDDRLEIWSDGNLPVGITIEDLKRDHLSRPRNPLIAEVFFRRGLVERWGRGTQKIVELCLRAGHPEPEFLEQSAAVGVRFLPSGYIAPLRVSHDLAPRLREILQFLSGKGRMPLRVIRAGLESSLSERTVQVDLAHLRRLGLIESGGRGRGAVYWLL